MLESLLNTKREKFSFTKSSIKKINLREFFHAHPLNARVAVGSYGCGDFELPLIYFYASELELRKIALALVFTTHSDNLSEYFAFKEKSLIRGLKITVAKPPDYQNVNVPESFKYQRKSKILRKYPWYPSSLKWNPLTELPSFGLSGLPGEKINLRSDGFLDRGKPHIVSISGYPSAIMRLARTLFDYANSNEPIEEIVFEVEGGFRGVGHYSYPVGFEICSEKFSTCN